MNIPRCWRTTDNRHWDSPARMSDGRIFTDWRSSCRLNAELAERARVSAGTFQFTEMLQKSHGVASQRGEAEARATIGDRWGLSYSAPPPKELIVANPRLGTSILETGAPGGIGVAVDGRGWVRGDTGGRISQDANTPVSVCSPMSVRSPSWALSPETLALNLRATSGGGTLPMAWLDGTRRA
jgi:hypothetical protein